MSGMPSTGPGGPGAPDIRPRRAWYGVGPAILIVGLAIAGVLVWQAASGFPRPVVELSSFEFRTVELDEEGLTIYASEGSYRGRCQARDSRGESVELRATAGRETATVDGRRWVVLYRTPEPVPGGSYVVGCESDDDATVFGIGPHTTVAGTVLLIFLAIGVAGLAFIIAGVFTLVLYFRRKGDLRRQTAAGGQVW